MTEAVVKVSNSFEKDIRFPVDRVGVRLEYASKGILIVIENTYPKFTGTFK